MQINPDFLATQPFLDGLPSRQLKLLTKEATPVEFGTDELIFEEGSPANRFYIILSGEVALESPCPECGEERRAPIETIGPGSVLGWSWLFPPYYAHFNARALSPVKAIFFYGTRLREECEDDHDLGYELMKRIAEIFIERLQATRRQLAGQSATILPALNP